MNSNRHELTRLRELIALNRRLGLETCQKSNELDQLFAAQKDALRRAARLYPGSESLVLNSSEWPEAAWPKTAPPAVPDRSNTDRQNAASSGVAGQPEMDGAWLLLVVEDEPDDFILLQRAVRQTRLHARTFWAPTAREALMILGQLGPEITRVCVVSDIELPGTDGFELLQRVRHLKVPQAVWFAFLTGHCDRATEQRAYHCGADAYYVKPVLFSELVEVAASLQALLSAHPSRQRDGERQ